MPWSAVPSSAFDVQPRLHVKGRAASRSIRFSIRPFWALITALLGQGPPLLAPRSDQTQWARADSRGLELLKQCTNRRLLSAPTEVLSHNRRSGLASFPAVMQGTACPMPHAGPAPCVVPPAGQLESVRTAVEFDVLDVRFAPASAGTDAVTLGRLQMHPREGGVVASGQGAPLQAAAALEQVKSGALLVPQEGVGAALALVGVAAGAQRAAHIAVVVAVVPHRRPRLRAHAAQVAVGTGAARAGRRVEHPVQVTGVLLEGGARARRAQGDVAEGARCAPGPRPWALGPAVAADPGPADEFLCHLWIRAPKAVVRPRSPSR